MVRLTLPYWLLRHYLPVLAYIALFFYCLGFLDIQHSPHLNKYTWQLLLPFSLLLATPFIGLIYILTFAWNTYTFTTKKQNSLFLFLSLFILHLPVGIAIYASIIPVAVIFFLLPWFISSLYAYFLHRLLQDYLLEKYRHQETWQKIHKKGMLVATSLSCWGLVAIMLLNFFYPQAIPSTASFTASFVIILAAPLTHLLSAYRQLKQERQASP